MDIMSYIPCNQIARQNNFKFPVQLSAILLTR